MENTFFLFRIHWLTRVRLTNSIFCSSRPHMICMCCTLEGRFAQGQVQFFATDWKKCPLHVKLSSTLFCCMPFKHTYHDGLGVIISGWLFLCASVLFADMRNHTVLTELWQIKLSCWSYWADKMPRGVFRMNVTMPRGNKQRLTETEKQGWKNQVVTHLLNAPWSLV